MRRLCSVLFLATLVVLLPNVQAGEFKLEDGFKLLFTGKNLDGWQPKGDKTTALAGKTEAFKGRFKVMDGLLVIDPNVKGGAYLETVQEFGKDVHIKLDFKPGPKCNNDLFLRGTKFDIVPAALKVEEGKWSTLDIIVTGDKVEHKINGVTARTSKTKGESSTFVIRAEFGEIQIKNIRVKE